LKNIKRMFRDAERLQPNPDLWNGIESQAAPLLSRMQRESQPAFASGWGAPVFKIAAAVTLAAGLAALGLSLQHRSKAAGALEAKAGVTDGGMSARSYPQTAEVVDPDLLVWDADLGELSTDADDTAEDML
jgi:hypothetical protein